MLCSHWVNITISNAVPRSPSFRGQSSLSWTLGNTQRLNASELVKVEPCESRRQAHCMKLTVKNVTARDTGRYFCKFDQDGSNRSSSIYVYVEGETLETLFTGFYCESLFTFWALLLIYAFASTCVATNDLEDLTKMSTMVNKNVKRGEYISTDYRYKENKKIYIISATLIE